MATKLINFNSQLEFDSFCHWNELAPLLVAGQDKLQVFVVPAPSIFKVDTEHNDNLLIVGSHTEELESFFESYSELLLKTTVSIEFHIIDVPGRSIANLWTRLQNLKRVGAATQALQPQPLRSMPRAMIGLISMR